MYKRYPNIILAVIPTSSNQIWVSDITYVEIEKSDYAYLSLITDMYSRKIVGFCLNKNLSAEGPLQSLKMAINSSNKTDLHMLIHHSDRRSNIAVMTI
ncbi:MAG: DDE-type integrase/transposase/recombinase [Saprospiraceae bacterium]|nr:DDE-type integrase/transposase/recombinase [Saprospiraceae bacterium]